MDIIVFVTLGFLVPKILEKLKIKINPYRGITASLSAIVGVILFLSYVLLNRLPSLKYIDGESMPIIPFISVLLILAIIVFLVQRRNPGPQGQVRVQRLCHLYDSMLLNDQVVATTNDQGVTNEPISKVITNDMALPISYRVGSQIPV